MKTTLLNSGLGLPRPGIDAAPAGAASPSPDNDGDGAVGEFLALLKGDAETPQPAKSASSARLEKPKPRKQDDGGAEEKIDVDIAVNPFAAAPRLTPGEFGAAANADQPTPDPYEELSATDAPRARGPVDKDNRRNLFIGDGVDAEADISLEDEFGTDPIAGRQIEHGRRSGDVESDADEGDRAILKAIQRSASGDAPSHARAPDLNDGDGPSYKQPPDFMPGPSSDEGDARSLDQNAMALKVVGLAAQSAETAALSKTAASQAPQLVQTAPNTNKFTISTIAREDDNVLQVRLDPPDLGKITIEFSNFGGANVKAIVTADLPGTLDFLRRHADQLTFELSRHGFSGADLQFTDHSAKDSPAYGGRRNNVKSFQIETPQISLPAEAPIRAYYSTTYDRFV